MSIAEKIWLFYRSARGEEDRFCPRLACGGESEYIICMSLLESSEGYIADSRISPKSNKLLNREQWWDWIQVSLLYAYEEIWIPEYNKKYEHLEVEFKYHALIGWTLYKSKPHQLQQGTLVLYPKDHSKVYR